MRNLKVVRVLCCTFLMTMVCCSCFAASLGKAVTIVRYTQPNVMPDMADTWYEDVANEVNTKLSKYGVQAESSKATWEAYAKGHLHQKPNKAEATKNWQKILADKYDSKINVFVDDYSTNLDGTSNVSLEIVLASSDDSKVISHGMFHRKHMDKSRPEVLSYAIDEVVKGFEKTLTN